MENHQKPLLLLQHVILKGYSKEAPVHTMKAFTRTGGIAPLILNLDTGWSSVISFMPQPLYPRDITAHTEWEGPHWFKHFGGERDLLSLPEVKPHISHHPA
jgi:hypothetical protein